MVRSAFPLPPRCLLYIVKSYCRYYVAAPFILGLSLSTGHYNLQAIHTESFAVVGVLKYVKAHLRWIALKYKLHLRMWPKLCFITRNHVFQMLHCSPCTYCIWLQGLLFYSCNCHSPCYMCLLGIVISIEHCHTALSSPGINSYITNVWHCCVLCFNCFGLFYSSHCQFPSARASNISTPRVAR